MPRNQATFSLSEIADATGGEVLRPGMSTHVRGVSTDTRVLSSGELFVALRGERFDGHSMLNQALQAGAAAALVEEDDAPDSLALIRVNDTKKALGDLARAHRLKFDVPVVGVTGSYGKTTTRALIAAALNAKFKVLASQGNFNNEIGVPMTLFCLDESHGAAVVEMGMRGLGQIAYLAQVARPTIGVISNIGPQHIELLGSMELIARAKAELIQALPPDGIAILPVEGDALPHEYSCIMREGAPHRVVTFGQNANADFRVSGITTARNGNVSFSLRDDKDVQHRVSLSMPGAHNALNAAAAIAVASVLGVEVEDAIRALATAQVPGARMRIVPCGGITIIDDCYNAGPDSMRAALETLRDFPNASRRVAVLGAMKELGQWSEDEHRKIGKLAASCAEVVVGVGPETRAMLEAASGVETAWCEDAKTAASRVKEIVREGDVVLAKGSRSVGLEVVVQSVVNAHGGVK